MDWEKAYEERDRTSYSILIIKNGVIVNDDDVLKGDILIKDGIIKEIGGPFSVPKDAIIIDATSKYIFPGGIDSNTHFEHPIDGGCSVDHFDSGSKAAIAGGTTTIINTAIDPSLSLADTLKKYKSMAEGKSHCDYAFHVALTKWSNDIPAQMKDLTTSFGINSFFLLPSESDFKPEELSSIFRVCKKLGALPLIHPESRSIIQLIEKVEGADVDSIDEFIRCKSEKDEAKHVENLIMSAIKEDCPIYVTNVMNKLVADIIEEQCTSGKSVLGEVNVASVVPFSNIYQGDFSALIQRLSSPHIRGDGETPKYLREKLMNKDLHTISSNHCTFSSKQKSSAKKISEIPLGINGVEERLPLAWNYGLDSDYNSFVRTCSTNPAKIYNLYPKKGVIKVGSDADIVIWDAHKEYVISAKKHQSTCDNNLYEGRCIKGGPDKVILRGMVIYYEGWVHSPKAAGCFLPTLPSPCHLKEVIKVLYSYNPKEFSKTYQSHGVHSSMVHSTYPVQNPEKMIRKKRVAAPQDNLSGGVVVRDNREKPSTSSGTTENPESGGKKPCT